MKHTILFVDDESQILEGLKNALRKEPFTIVTATSGEQGLALLAKQRVDVVVSDERMPGMPGSEFLAAVRQRYPDTIRIILTGQGSLDAAIRAINEGEVYRFLTKPCNPVDLSFTIRHALQLRDLTQKSTALLAKVRRQEAALTRLEEAHPGITMIERDASGAIVLDDDPMSPEDLIREIENEVRGARPGEPR